MNHVSILLGGESYSVEYYFNNDNYLIIYTIQDLNGIDLYEKLPDETFEELHEILTKHYGAK